MRFQCVSCDVTFDVDGEKPRCPRCRKTTGLEAVAAPAARRSLTTPILIVAVVAAIGGGYFWWSTRAPEGVPSKVPLRPLEAAELRAFAKDRGVTASHPPDPFQLDDGLRAFAEKTAHGKSGVAALAALQQALVARREHGDYVPFQGVEPRDTEIRPANRTFAALEKKRRDRPYSLELATVLAASARAVDTPAMIVELLDPPNARAPLDPSGYRGHFGVVVDPGSRRPKKALDVFDPHRGVRTRVAPRGLVVLDDVAVLGHFMNHQAVYRLAQASDPAGALERVQIAAELAPGAPAVLETRGAILLASGGVDEGTRELERAYQLRGDAARRHNLGAAYLVKEDAERAGREIGAALAAAPDFAAAHASLGALHVLRGELADAEDELRTAERLEPDMSSLPMLWANLYMARHEPEEAIAHAQEGVRRRPNDDVSRLRLASLYRAMGRVLDMRRELRTVLERSKQPEQIRELIRANFGPAALDAAMEEEPAVEAAAAPEPDAGAAPEEGASGSLQLGSKVLGTGQASGQAGPRLNLGDGSRLNLGGSRDPGGGFRLRIGEP